MGLASAVYSVGWYVWKTVVVGALSPVSQGLNLSVPGPGADVPGGS